MRDWRRLPYWNTTVPVENTIGDIYKLLIKTGLKGYRVTQALEPWRLMVEWEQRVGDVLVVVNFDLTIPEAELWDFTPRQQQSIYQQGARLVLHTIKNLIAATEAGIISFGEVFLARMTHPNGQTLGSVILQQIQAAGELSPGIIQKALPAGGRA